MLNSYIVPEELKPEFRKKYGKLYTSIEEIKKHLKDKRVICVGDRISSEIIKSDIKPDMIIFDFKENRNPVDDNIKESLNNLDYFLMEIDNPPSHITDELWKAIRICLKLNKKTKIKIHGEEDLSVLPVILEADENTVILYGFMDKGFILIKVDKDLKNKCEDLLKKMNKGR